MHKFTYKISFRIRHPYMDPTALSTELSLVPKFQWKAGEEKRSPKGRPLEGINRETYWSYDVKIEEDNTLTESLEIFLISLKPHKKFLSELRATGGSVECFIGWFSGPNSGETFDYTLLSLFSELEVDLSLDIYGQSEYTVKIISDESP